MRKYLKFLICIVVVLALWAVPFKIVVVKGDSMLPNLKNNQVLLAVKTNNFSVDDIVVAKNDYSETIIKRIKYVGGDNYYYSFSKDSAEFTLIEDCSYANLYKIISSEEQSIMHLVVPKNQYYILGDNRDESDVSRRFGSIHKESIIYKIVN